MIRHLPLAPFHHLARAMSSHPPNESAFAFGPKLTVLSFLSLLQQLLKLTAATPASTLRHQFANTCIAERHPTGNTFFGASSQGHAERHFSLTAPRLPAGTS
ncbi:unnamed protein product [Prunus armeniaca]